MTYQPPGPVVHRRCVTGVGYAPPAYTRPVITHPTSRASGVPLGPGNRGYAGEGLPPRLPASGSGVCVYEFCPSNPGSTAVSHHRAARAAAWSRLAPASAIGVT